MLLTICNYFKKCFCKHEFEYTSNVLYFERREDFIPSCCKAVYICKKCGRIKRIIKY